MQGSRRSPADESADCARLRVLVVEDNLDMASALAQLLALLGHDAAIAHGGQAALALARESRPDLVLLDLGLPDMDGHEVARRLRAELGSQAPMLVAMTGYGEDEDRRRSAAAGCEHHLVKPIQFADVERLLSTCK